MNFTIMFDKEKCIGCTNCMKKCPTQAIRLKDGKASIDNNICIHCGECIKICPYEAYSSESVESHKDKNYKFKIAIPSTTLYGQFPKGTEICRVHNAIFKLGFDYVYDESWASELVSVAIKKRIEGNIHIRPFISTNCPSIVRLIKIRYPSLIEHLISLEAPMEIAARLAKTKVKELFNLEDKDIGIFYISPCPAKMLSVSDPLGKKPSLIDWVIPLSTIFSDLYKDVKKDNGMCASNPSLKGIKWSYSGGQSEAANLINYIAVNGMDNIIDIFDEIENGRLFDIDFVEALTCVDGCVGGTFNIVNPYIARNTLKYIEYNTNPDLLFNDDLEKFNDFYKEGVLDCIISPDEAYGQKVNMKEAVQKIERIEEILSALPGLDCGSCGAPNCLALAEDIYNNEAEIYDCVVLKAKLNENKN
ncbi:MAG: [Fe-Fe] hydrogenase large subunit C-terminal domain-containing protein [Tissierellia bacterium]|nr:[Fe-Fe] hydrogenase large subunit C-terminal domain-containing protein [Tissierellia bacterium]